RARDTQRRGLTLWSVELAGIGEGGGALAVAGAGHGLAVDGDGVVDAHDHEVARVRPPQSGLDRGHLVQDLVDPDRLARAFLPRLPHAVRNDRRRRTRLPTTKVAVLADDDLVESPGRERAVRAHVLVAAVAGHADHPDRATVETGPRSVAG